MKLHALVTAGGVPEAGDPLYEFSQGRSKALIDVAGKPMVQWVLDALSASNSIGQVVIVGVDESAGLSCKKPLAYLANQGGMLDNIRGGARKIAELDPRAEYTLIVSSDIPLINAEMVDWVCAQVRPGEDEGLYSVILRQTMEERFPNSMRTFTKLKDMHVCGGDMNPFSIPLILSHTGPWEKIADARKSPIKQAGLVGLDTLLLLLLGQLTLESAAARVSKNLGLRARAIVNPYAEVGMDVDKPHHLEIVRRVRGQS
ncbi:MAG: nucleotidyltransferase family protein [Anaerolineales bacterium]|nr:nucleotidyltransferase family protein [Anaerolineales bacterium]MCW5856530.1 nucleotidyltransferase family protein [Anaerolineales bacterium]